MCKRNTADPLVRTFLDTYGLNLLTIPRTGAEVGDLYVVAGKGTTTAGALHNVLTPGFTLPAVTAGEMLADLAGKISGRVDAKASLGLLEGFLSAIGAAAVVGNIRAAYETKRTNALRFRLTSVTRDSVDPLEFGAALIGQTLDPRHPFVEPGNRYLVTTAVVRTPSLSVIAENERAISVDLEAKALEAASAQAGVTATKTADGEVTYEGSVPIAIGVELHELAYDSARKKFRMEVTSDAVRVRSIDQGGRESTPSFIGDAKTGQAFVAIGP